jgi:streptogramin lyase
MGVTGDGAGNLYVADSTNNAIRRIVLATGEVSTIAGGKFGNADGIGTAAQLAAPYGMTCDGTTLYFVDQQGNEIRKMALTTGQVTTLAGTPYTAGYVDGVGSAARFNMARNLVYDGAGHLYIVEKNNSSIRRLDLATNQVTGYVPPAQGGFANGPVATAHFNTPYDIASDGAGHLYIADSYNSLIRRVDLSTGTVSIAVGVYTNGSSGVILRSPSTTRLNMPTALAVLPGGSGVVFADERALLIAWF